MTTQRTHRELLKAMALGDAEQANRLSVEVPEGEKNEYHQLVTALFCILLEHRFKVAPTRDVIADFVTEMRHDYRHAQPPIKPLAIEGTIRASLGEDHVLDEISAEDVLAAEYQVIRKIVVQSNEAATELDKLLTDAQLLVESWGG